MSFIRFILVFFIIYAVCSILYKRYKAKKKRDSLTGPELLKSLGDNTSGVIFVNQTSKALNLKLEIFKNSKVVWTDYFELGPEGGKMPFYTGTHLHISLSDDNTLSLLLNKTHHEYTVTIDTAGVIRSKSE